MDLEQLDGWTQEGEIISKTFTFEDFVDAVAFVNQVAVVAETANHHPDIDIRWNKVRLVLSTHSEGKLTEKDFTVAKEIDKLD